MEAVCEDDLCWLQLEDFRMLLIKTIDPSRITPYLRQCQVLINQSAPLGEPAGFSLVVLWSGDQRRGRGAALHSLGPVLCSSCSRSQQTFWTVRPLNCSSSCLSVCLSTCLSACPPVCLSRSFVGHSPEDRGQKLHGVPGESGAGLSRPVPNKTFSILIDTAGESGLTQFLMSELNRLQRALQDQRRCRQQACSVAKEQEAWSRQQQLRDHELRKLTERVQKIREERERLSEEVKQLRDHNYSLMADINSLNQERSNALLANRDLQIEVERLRHTVLRAENQTRLLRRRTLRPLQESRSLALPTGTFFHPNRPEEPKEEKQEEKEEEPKEEKKEEMQQQEGPGLPHMNLLTTVFRLRRELHRAEEQRTRSVEVKEELELRCAQLKGDAKIYRQQNKQTLRQLEEVIRERDKALTSRAEQQEEARLLLQEKDQYREQVRQLTEQSDRLELLLLKTQGEELQLRTRLRRITCNSHQCERSVSSEEEEEPTDSAAKGSSEEVRSGTSGENEEAAAHQQQLSSSAGEPESEHKASNAASWQEEQTDSCLRGRLNFFYRRKRALRSKFTSKEFTAGNLDDSSDITDSD